MRASAQGASIVSHKLLKRRQLEEKAGRLSKTFVVFEVMNNFLSLPTTEQQQLLERIQVHLIEPGEYGRCQQLLEQHHYLGGIHAVGEQMYYVAKDFDGRWLAVLVFCAAAKHLKHRDRWIGWSEQQRWKRLALVGNNARFLILPGAQVPNLASRILRLTLQRLSEDWQKQYGHPILVVETFVDPQRFRGTAYRANGWIELGRTAGFARCAHDYYVEHAEPKALFVKQLRKNACRSLQAEHLKPDLVGVEAQAGLRCTQSVPEIRSLRDYFQKLVPDFRSRIESYPLSALLSIVACAHFCGAPTGPSDLASFARRLTKAQRRALRIRRDKTGRYPSPSQPTFSRVLFSVDAKKVEAAILAFQTQVRGKLPSQEMVAIDGKQPKHSQGQHLLNAVSLPSQHYLGSLPVDEKTNEIPVARELIPNLDLQGRMVGLDALHTQTQTARQIVQEAGGDYLLTVKDNQKGIRETLQTLMTATPAAFSPSTHVGE